MSIHNRKIRDFFNGLLGKSFLSLYMAAKVGKFTVHTLRKCAGQNWADYLPMNVVKELMGHSNIATTAEFYNQVDRDHELKAARVIQSLLESNKNATSPNELCADFASKPILDEITDKAK